MLDAEEVLALEWAIFRQVGAVDGVAASIYTETGANRIWSQILSYFRVHRTSQLTERSNCILLSDLHNNAGSCRHLLAHWCELGQHALVDLEELFGRGAIEVEHLHG